MKKGSLYIIWTPSLQSKKTLSWPILDALAGRVGSVVVRLLRPRSRRTILYVSNIELSHIIPRAPISSICPWQPHYNRWISSFSDLSAAGKPITRYVSRTNTQQYTFFFMACGFSSDIVLRLCAYSTSRNPAPVATPQQARLVYSGFLSQSLHPYNRRFADCGIIFRSSKHRSAFIVPDLPSLMRLRAWTEL